MKKHTIAILSATLGALVGGTVIGIKPKNDLEDKITKFKTYYNMMNQWVALKQEGKTLVSYFVENNYKCIAIYGMGEVGQRLYEELKNTEIEIKYAIDKNAGSIYSELEVYGKQDMLEDVDVIVVTAPFAFNEIEKQLEAITNSPIISLEDIIFEV